MFACNKSVTRNRAGQLRRLSFESLENRLLLAAEIDVWCGAEPVPVGDAVDFGTVAQGASGRTRTFSVYNRGNEVLTLGAISLPEGFRVKENLASAIRPHSADRFTIELMTSNEGFNAGDLRFSSNDANENPYQFQIAGEVTAPNDGTANVEVVCLSCGKQPVRTGSTIDFGTSLARGSGNLRVFRVSNFGDENLHLGALEVPEGFRLLGRLPQTIRPGRSADFTLVMKTGEAGMKACVVRFTSDAANADTFEFEVIGEVAQRGQPELDVLSGGDPVRSGSGVDLGTATEGDPARERTFTVINRGLRTLTLGTLEVPDGFQLVEGLRSTLRPGARDTFTIEMTTEEPGLQSGAVRFDNNDPNENPYEFTIQGEVLAAVFGTPSQPDMDIYCMSNGQRVPDGGTVYFSSTANTKQFNIYNRGPGGLSIGNFSLPVNSGYSVTPLNTPWPASILTNGYVSFKITMNPSVAGTDPVWLEIANNDPDENPFYILLRRQ